MTSPDTPGGVFLSIPFGSRADWRTGSLPLDYKPRDADKFIETLGREIELRAPAFDSVPLDPVYVGGCGPTAISLDQLYRLLELLYNRVRIVPTEQSIIVLPGTVDEPRAKVLRESGFDRVELRPADLHSCRADFAVLRDAGFATVGIELGPAGDAGLALLAELAPDHVALYDRPAAGHIPAGYDEYGPNHFCRPGHECLFLRTAWSTAPLLGLGPGAVTRIGGRFERNETDPGRWAAALKRGHLPVAEAVPGKARPYAPDASDGLQP